MADKVAYDMLALATRLAEDAADISLARFGAVSTKRKADDTVVTETDHAIQGRILGAIAEAYPDHAVFAEETVRRPEAHAGIPQARYCWVIDPLDGTRNYAAGFPCFSTSIAVLDRGRPITAVVYEHQLKRLHTAVAGEGAKLNDRPIRIEKANPDVDMLVAIPTSKDQLAVAVACNWVATPGLICRNVGSTALHLAMVASGALSAVFCKRSKIWDLAAGALIVVEAGGRITDPFGGNRLPFDLRADPEENLPFLAAAPCVHERLLDSIRTALQAATRT
jgi:myo-inositol-1(or 4)-monophosphatase